MAPYRSWVALLIRRWLEDETHEIEEGAPANAIPTPDFARNAQSPDSVSTPLD